MRNENRPIPPHERDGHVPPHLRPGQIPPHERGQAPHERPNWERDEPTHGELLDKIEVMNQKIDRIERILEK